MLPQELYVVISWHLDKSVNRNAWRDFFDLKTSHVIAQPPRWFPLLSSKYTKLKPAVLLSMLLENDVKQNPEPFKARKAPPRQGRSNLFDFKRLLFVFPESNSSCQVHPGRIWIWLFRATHSATDSVLVGSLFLQPCLLCQWLIVVKSRSLFLEAPQWWWVDCSWSLTKRRAITSSALQTAAQSSSSSPSRWPARRNWSRYTPRLAASQPVSVPHSHYHVRHVRPLPLAITAVQGSLTPFMTKCFIFFLECFQM